MPVLLENKKAHFNYEILEKYDAGIELKGYEVKALKTGKGNIVGSRVIVRGGEAYVVGMDIPPYQPKNTPPDYEPQRTRRLLLHKEEISRIAGKAEERGLTIEAAQAGQTSIFDFLSRALGRDDLPRKSSRRSTPTYSSAALK